MESVYHIVIIRVNETSWAHIWSLRSLYLRTGYDTMSDMVARLAIDRCQESGCVGTGAHGGVLSTQQELPNNRLMFGRNRGEDEPLPPRSALPKMSFPKFHGKHPHIWLDKCVDYFRIFNIP
jgi:hypothetical protein